MNLKPLTYFIRQSKCDHIRVRMIRLTSFHMVISYVTIVGGVASKVFFGFVIQLMLVKGEEL